ncbi:MAG: transglutaminase-like domain-containing protein [Planctomycetota bacterium]|jgi:transglutaminase-like putative cysteine protease
MATPDGDVYDVDFFLTGDPGNMTVTETTIHKFNGKPDYVWKQKRDKTWHRIEVDDAPPEVLGAIQGSDRFEFLYQATLPELADAARMWIPIPTSDAFQTVQTKSIKAPGTMQMLKDSEHGNSVMFLELDADDSGKTIEIRCQVQRLEKGVYESTADDPKQYLNPERMVPADERFRTIAAEVVEGKTGDLVRARALYDHVIETMRYAKAGEGWGQGDAVFACDARHGNCTDFHSYFIALCRAIEIPARFAIGVAIPSARDEGAADGYHCWAEFYTDGKWWPVDISEGDKCSPLSTYYFGHHPANRVELSRGRDLVLDPGPESGPINFLAYPVLEINGSKSRLFLQPEHRREALRMIANKSPEGTKVS